MLRGVDNWLQQREAHFVVPIVVRLVKAVVFQLGLVGNDYASKMQVVVIKKVVNDRPVKVEFCWRNFCLFELELR